MKSATAAILSTVIFTTALAVADQPTLAQTGQEIETASHNSDLQALAQLQQQLLTASKQDGADKYAFYYLGYADYALADLYAETDTSHATDCLHAAEAALEHAVKLDPGFAEASALLGGSYDFEIGLHPFKGMWLGSKADKLLANAAKQSPGNPRVLMLQAMSDYSTPATFGGDKQRAMQEYASALADFDAFKAGDAEAPQWGHAEAYVWRGDAEAEMQQVQAAAKDYQAALALAPGYKLAAQHLSKLASAPASPAKGSTAQ